MARDTAKRKEKLRETLIEIAERQIIEGGLRSLKARTLATQANCAVGAIYNVFADINALVMAVNGRTFHTLGALVADATKRAGRVGPNDRLIAMSNAYLGFASDNTNLWRALFDLEMSADGPVPDWYLYELGLLFSHIAQPLTELFPDMSQRELDLMTRALFSSVHGIVLLGLERRISAVPQDNIQTMIAQILSQIGE